MAQGGRIDYTIGFKTDKAGLTELRNQLKELGNITQTELFNMNPGKFQSVQKDAQSALYNIKKTIKEVDTAFDNAFDSKTGLMNLQKLNTSLNQIGLDKIYKNFSLMGDQGQQAFYKVTKAALTTEMQFKKTQTMADKLGQTLINTIKWQISSKAINSFTGAIQQAYGYVQHLDTSLNDIRIVTNKSAEDMAEFAVQANKAAKALGQSTTNYTEASLIYYQQGLSDEEVAARAETTLKAANVTGQSTSQVSEQLTAVWNGYQIQAENTEMAVDKLAAVAATTASDLEELSTGMSKVASSANAMGVDMDQLNAQISTIISVTRQAPESVGTALKTIYARMGDLKLGGADEEGIELGDVSGTLDQVGITVLDANGNLREMGDIIEEVAAKWQTWTEAQQIAIAEVMAGKRQYNNLIALFENWDMYTSALETSKNATGTLQQQQDIYMESTKAHLQQLKTQWEDLYDSLLNTDTINNIVDDFTKLISLFTNFTDSLGGGNNLLLMLGSTAMRVFKKQFGEGLFNVISSFQRAKENAKELQAQMALIDAFQKSQGYNSNSAVKALVDAQKQVSKYYDVLSNEQINEANRIAQQVGDAKELEEQWKRDAQAVNEYAEATQKAYGSVKTGRNAQGKIKYQSTSDFDLTKEQPAKFQAVGERFSQSTQEIEKFEGSLKKAEKAYDLFMNPRKNTKIKEKLGIIRKESQKLQSNFENLNKTGLLKNMKADKINQISTAFENVKKSSDDDLASNFEKLKEAFKDLPEEAKKELAKLQKVFEQSGSTNFSAPVKDLSQFLQTAELKNFTTNIMDTAGAVGQLASSISSLTHLSDIWTSEDLTTGEKIFQTVSNLSSTLPMFVSSISTIGSSLKNIGALALTMKGQLLGIVSVQSQVNAATGVWNALTEEQQASMLGLLGVQNLEEVQITEENAQLIISNGLKTGNAKATAVMESAELGAAGATKILTGGIKKLAAFIMSIPGIGWILGIATGIAAVATALTLHQKNLEKQAEIDTQAAEKAKEHADALKEQKDHVDELAKSYEDLQEQINKHEISVNDARQQIYDLCKQYDLQDLAVKTLTADYEELGDIISETQKKANEAYEEGLEDLQEKQLQALKSNIWASAGSERDMVGGKQTIDLFGMGGSNTGLAEGKRRNFEQDLSSLGLDVDNGGHINLEDLIQVAATNEEALYEILNKYNIRASNQIREILKDNAEEIKAYGETIDETLNSQRTIKANEIIDINTINSVTDLEEAKELLKDSSLKEMFDTSEEMDAWVNDFFSSIDSIKDYAQKSEIGAEILKNTNFSEAEIDSQLDKRSQTEINFLANNTNLAKAYGDLDDFFDYYEDYIDYENKNNNLLNVEVAFNNSDGTTFDEDSINILFDNTNFSVDLGISKEDFLSSTYQQQQAYLLQYYLLANQEEVKYQELLQGRNEKEEERYNQIKDTSEELLALQEKYENISLNQMSSDYAQGLSQSMESQAEDWFYSNYSNSDWADETIQEVGSAKNALEQYFEAGEEGYNNLSDGVKDYITALHEAGYTDEILQKNLDLIEASEEYQDVVSKNPKLFDESADAAEHLIDEYAELKFRGDKVTSQTRDWSSYGKEVKKALAGTNQGIDDLQSAYNSLTSIMDEYNQTGVLSLDNLQAFLNMDTAYLSALQIENGQMTLNEEALKQIALARLDEAEAEAYEQAMSELNDAQRRTEIQGMAQASSEVTKYGNAAVAAGEAARQGAAGWREYWTAALNKEGVANDAYAQQVGQALYTKLQAIDSVRQQILSGGLGASVKGPSSASGSGGSGGGSSKEPDQEEFVNYEADIYHKINAELEDIEEKLGRIQTVGDHTWGKSQVDVLNQEKELLDENIDKLEEKIELQQKDLSVRKKQLENEGFTFSDDSAVILNREEQIKALWDGYDAMVAQYNSMSADAQESYKATLEAEKDRVQQISDALDRYEDVYGEYQSALDDWLDKQYEIIETQIEAFNSRVEIQLELDEAERDWITFKKEVIDDIEDIDFGGRIAASLATLTTFLGPDGEIAMLTGHLSESIAEIGESMRGLETNFTHDGVFDTEAARQQLEDYRDKLMDAVRAAKEEVDEVSETYLDALDDAKDKIDKQIEGWENIGDQIQHDIDLIKKVGGEKSYEALVRLYDQQHQNNLETIQAERMSITFWEQRMAEERAALEIAEEGSVDWKTHNEALEEATKNWNEAIKNMNSTVMDALDALEEWKDSQLNSIQDAFDKLMSRGIGLDQLENEWNLVNDIAGRYLDNVERAVEMDGLDNLFDKALDNANLTAAAQKQINDLRDEELSKLRDREKISQYDIDLAKSRLNILQQQIALEDAQKNKSNLRLRRDSQGNYNYQYVGDDSQIANAEEGLMSAKGDWYQLVKKRNLDLTNDIIQNRKDLSQALKTYAETDWTNDEEGRQKQLELIALYEQKERDLQWDTENARRDFFDGTAQYFADVEDHDILPQWNTTVNSLINKWTDGGEDGEEGFTKAVTNGINEITSTQNTFAEKTNEVLTTAGINYKNLYEQGIDPTKQKLEDLVDTNEDFSDTLDDINDKLDDYADKLQDVEDAYNSLEDAAASAIQGANEMLRQLANTAVDTVNQINNAINSASSAPSFAGSSNYRSSAGGGTSGGLGGTGGGLNGNGYYLHIDHTSAGQTTPEYIVFNANGTIKDRGKINDYTIDKVKALAKKALNYNQSASPIKYGQTNYHLPKLKGHSIESSYGAPSKWTLKTGGYTGTWPGSNLIDDYASGRLALLHQKELVLNETDTKNILDAVSAVREMDTSVYSSSILNDTISKINSLLNITSELFDKVNTVQSIDNSNSMNYNGDININADFSGVKNADAIYEALTELENYGLQTAYSNLNSQIQNKF